MQKEAGFILEVVTGNGGIYFESLDVSLGGDGLRGSAQGRKFL